MVSCGTQLCSSIAAMQQTRDALVPPAAKQALPQELSRPRNVMADMSGVVPHDSMQRPSCQDLQRLHAAQLSWHACWPGGRGMPVEIGGKLRDDDATLPMMQCHTCFQVPMHLCLTERATRRQHVGRVAHHQRGSLAAWQHMYYTCETACRGMGSAA